jgi:hypothetical protein
MVHSSPNSHRTRCAKLEKKEHCNWWTPPLCIQRCSSSLTPIQILRMLRHGGNLTLWRDIGRFFLSWGYIEISLNNTYTGIVKNRRQPWTSPRQRWIHHFFIARAHVSHPIFVTKHPQTTRMRQGNKHSLHCLLFLSKNRPLCKYFYSGESAGTTACRPPFLPFTTHVPHKRVSKATRTCRGNMLLKNRKQMKWLLIVACHEWIYFIVLVDNPTRFSPMLFFIYQ